MYFECPLIQEVEFMLRLYFACAIKFEYNCKIIMNFESGILPPKKIHRRLTNRLPSIATIAKVYIFDVRQQPMMLIILAFG